MTAPQALVGFGLIPANSRQSSSASRKASPSPIRRTSEAKLSARAKLREFASPENWKHSDDGPARPRHRFRDSRRLRDLGIVLVIGISELRSLRPFFVNAQNFADRDVAQAVANESPYRLSPRVDSEPRWTSPLVRGARIETTRSRCSGARPPSQRRGPKLVHYNHCTR